MFVTVRSEPPSAQNQENKEIQTAAEEVIYSPQPATTEQQVVTSHCGAAAPRLDLHSKHCSSFSRKVVLPVSISRR